MHRIPITAVLSLLLSGCLPQRGRVLEKVPQILPLQGVDAAERLLPEFHLTPLSGSLPDVAWPDYLGVTGTVDPALRDTVATNALWIVVSHEGSDHRKNHRVFMLDGASGTFVPLSGMEGIIINRICLIENSGNWDIALSGIGRQGGRCHIFRYNLKERTLQQLWPGKIHWRSPDHRKVLFSRSDDGFHSLHVWAVDRECFATIMSAWEGDPGSGSDWRMWWSSDSQALFLTGSTQGFARKGPRTFSKFSLIYILETDEIYGAPCQSGEKSD